MIENFSSDVCEKIGYYVYRLVDPRNGQTFYVGKGKDNRVFDHIKYTEKLIDEIKNENKKESVIESEEEIIKSLKLSTIRDIKDAGLRVIHIIHRWGIKTPEEAFLVEAAVIDCFPGLTNIQSGHDDGYGVVNCETLQETLTVTEFIEPDNIEDFIIIKIRQDKLENAKNRYEATRFCWRINIEQAKKHKYVLSVTGGIVKAIYNVNKWEIVTKDNAIFETDIGRYFFEGVEVEDKGINETFLNKRIPKKYCKKGMASPFLYCIK